MSFLDPMLFGRAYHGGPSAGGGLLTPSSPFSTSSSAAAAPSYTSRILPPPPGLPISQHHGLEVSVGTHLGMPFDFNSSLPHHMHHMMRQPSCPYPPSPSTPSPLAFGGNWHGMSPHLAMYYEMLNDMSRRESKEEALSFRMPSGEASGSRSFADSFAHLYRMQQHLHAPSKACLGPCCSIPGSPHQLQNPFCQTLNHSHRSNAHKCNCCPPPSSSFSSDESRSRGLLPPPPMLPSSLVSPSPINPVFVPGIMPLLPLTPVPERTFSAPGSSSELLADTQVQTESNALIKNTFNGKECDAQRVRNSPSPRRYSSSHRETQDSSAKLCQLTKVKEEEVEELGSRPVPKLWSPAEPSSLTTSSATNLKRNAFEAFVDDKRCKLRSGEGMERDGCESESSSAAAPSRSECETPARSDAALPAPEEVSKTADFMTSNSGNGDFQSGGYPQGSPATPHSAQVNSQQTPSTKKSTSTSITQTLDKGDKCKPVDTNCVKSKKISSSLKQLKDFKLLAKNPPKVTAPLTTPSLIPSAEKAPLPDKSQKEGEHASKETRTIEVQCDGPDWTPVILRTQVKNRLLKIKEKSGGKEKKEEEPLSDKKKKSKKEKTESKELSQVEGQCLPASKTCVSKDEGSQNSACNSDRTNNHKKKDVESKRKAKAGKEMLEDVSGAKIKKKEKKVKPSRKIETGVKMCEKFRAAPTLTKINGVQNFVEPRDPIDPLPPPPPLTRILNPNDISTSVSTCYKPQHPGPSAVFTDPPPKKKKDAMCTAAKIKPVINGRRRRPVRSGMDMIRNRKVDRKKKLKGKSLDNDLPSSSNHLASASSHEAPTKRLSVNRAIGETVLHRASRMGYVDIVISVLSSPNCDSEVIGARDNAGYTPLHECAARGHLEIARYLLSHGADVNASAAGGIRAVHDAVEGDHVELVRLLLSYGADPTISTYSGLTPLKLARSKAMVEFIRGFLFDLNGETPDNLGPVMPWKFSGNSSVTHHETWSVEGFDPVTCEPSDPAPVVDPEDDQEEPVMIEESERPFCPSFRLALSSCSKMQKGSKNCNYLRLSDVLDHLGLQKDDFCRRFNQVNIVSVPGEEFDSKVTCNQLLTSRRRRENSRSQEANSSQLTLKSNDASSCVDLVPLDDILRQILDIAVIKIA